MTPTLDKAFGYRGDAMNLPVKDIETALPFYASILGFHLVSRSETPHRAATVARDGIQMRLVENGGDPSQDGCAFHVTGLESLLAQFKANGMKKESSDFSIERRGDAAWRVFYVVAPDGLCYWFGERQA
jgi:catechol 2,3-dioxygenase-like lactoylglutathione lyase family enzyme